jgi:hypothetical protein
MSFFSWLGWLENNGLWDTALKEVGGSNIPKVLLARSWDERLDVGSCEIGCTIGVFGSGLLLDKALGSLFKKAQAQGGTAEKWAVLGRSVALFSLVSSVMWGMPFVRNYLTARRTGSIRFTEVIGATTQTSVQQQSNQDTVAEYRNKSLEILGAGLGMAALATGTAWMAIRKGWGLGPLAKLMDQRVFKNLFLLKDGAFKHLTGMPCLLFWGLPSYGGLLQASRDKYERKEHLLKLVMFVGFFFVPPFLFKGYFNRQLKKAAVQLPHLAKEGVATYSGLITELNQHAVGSPERQVVEKLLRSWKIKSAGGLGSSLFLFSTIPQLMNIHLTRKRLAENEESLENAALISASAMPSMNPLDPLYKPSHNSSNQQQIGPQGYSSFAFPHSVTFASSASASLSVNNKSPFSKRLAMPYSAYMNRSNPLFAK